MRQDEGKSRVASTGRTERQVLEELSEEERDFLKRVLQVERAKLHVSAHDATDELLAAVKEIIP